MDVRLRALKEAWTGLAYLVSVDMGALARQFDARLIDGLKNGVAQKFEYTFELCMEMHQRLPDWARHCDSWEKSRI